MKNNNKIYTNLTLSEELILSDKRHAICGFLEGLKLPYDTSKDKSRIMVVFTCETDLTYYESFLEKELQAQHTAMLDVSAEMPTDQVMETILTYRLYFDPVLVGRVQHMLLKLFPAKNLIK